jgi:carbamoyl-phosphate synthase large subunit
LRRKFVSKPFNILLSSAGRRVTLLNLFRKTIEDLGLTGQMIATDVSPLAAAWQRADVHYIVPPCDAPDYIESLLSISRQHDVSLIVPTIDTELPLLAAHRVQFEALGTTVLVSSPECIRITADKSCTNHWLTVNRFPTVQQTSVLEAIGDARKWPLPLIAKPRNGSSSIGLLRLTGRGAMEQLLERNDYVIETVAGGQEYTVDVLVDRRAKVLCAVPRRRMEVRAGEVSKGVTVRSEPMQELATAVCEHLPEAYGVINVQMFKAEDGTLAVVEINARFGGGFPLSARAGADYPRWIIEELMGVPSTARANAWQDGLGMLRYDAEVFLDLGGQQIA